MINVVYLYTRNSLHWCFSTESGWDNPFRPDGDLSREADEIVSLIKGGKPITPTPTATPQLPVCEEDEKDHANNVSVSRSVHSLHRNGNTNGVQQIATTR